MKTEIYTTQELFKPNYESLRKLKKAHKLAWFFFIGIGIAYIALTIFTQVA